MKKITYGSLLNVSHVSLIIQLTEINWLLSLDRIKKSESF